MIRPHILVNVAMTADGKIDTATRKGATISSRADKMRLDGLRASVDAVMVGGRTLLSEDPKLTVKSAKLRCARTVRGLPENPAKVGVVSVADIRPGGDFLMAGPARRLVYTTSRTAQEQIARLKTSGVEVFIAGKERVNLKNVLQSLHTLGVRVLLVEGGGTLIAELFRLEAVDELTIYIAPKIFGGKSAPTLADGPGFSKVGAPHLQLAAVEKLDAEGGVLLRYQVINNPA